MLPLELVDRDERPAREMAEQFMRMAGTPFISAFSPAEFQTLAREAGFKEAHHVSTAEMRERYFANRTDGLRPSSAEQMLVAST
jgi:O-methyltransferase involved in polyketide biosynthesis